VRVAWVDAHLYSQGVSNGVLYPENSPGVPWSGLISIQQTGDSAPSGLYFDGQKYRDESVLSAFAGTISAFTYPDEFEPCIGLDGGFSAQPRQPFGFTYRDTREIHIVYNASVSPSSDQYESTGGDISPVAFAWDFSTAPVEIPFGRPTSHLVIVTDFAEADALAALEDILYGDDENAPSLPDPQTVYELFESNTTLRITDNGDGTWTATGPDDVVVDNGDGTFTINWPSALFIDATTYQIYSL
jgi:hypothetical protein